MNLLIFGDSIAWGAWDEKGGWAQRIKSYADQKAIANNFDNDTTVYCVGVDGDNTQDLLARFDTEVAARTDKENRLLILIGIGINDSQYVLESHSHRVSKQEYENNLVELIKKAKHHQANLIFIGLTPVNDSRVDPTPWTPGKSYRLEFVKQYDQILKTVSENYNIPYVEIMSSFLQKDYKELLIDGLHPNTQGHELMFEQIKNFLISKNLI